MALHKIDNNTWLNENEFQQYMANKELDNSQMICGLFLLVFSTIPAYGLMTIFCSWIELPSWGFWVGLVLMSFGFMAYYTFLVFKNPLLFVLGLALVIGLGYFLFDNYLEAYEKVWPSGNLLHEFIKLVYSLFTEVILKIFE